MFVVIPIAPICYFCSINCPQNFGDLTIFEIVLLIFRIIKYYKLCCYLVLEFGIRTFQKSEGYFFVASKINFQNVNSLITLDMTITLCPYLRSFQNDVKCLIASSFFFFLPYYYMCHLLVFICGGVKIKDTDTLRISFFSRSAKNFYPQADNYLVGVSEVEAFACDASSHNLVLFCDYSLENLFANNRNSYLNTDLLLFRVSCLQTTS